MEANPYEPFNSQDGENDVENSMQPKQCKLAQKEIYYTITYSLMVIVLGALLVCAPLALPYIRHQLNIKTSKASLAYSSCYIGLFFGANLAGVVVSQTKYPNTHLYLILTAVITVFILGFMQFIDSYPLMIIVWFFIGINLGSIRATISVYIFRVEKIPGIHDKHKSTQTDKKNGTKFQYKSRGALLLARIYFIWDLGAALFAQIFDIKYITYLFYGIITVILTYSLLLFFLPTPQDIEIDNSKPNSQIELTNKTTPKLTEDKTINNTKTITIKKAYKYNHGKKYIYLILVHLICIYFIEAFMVTFATDYCITKLKYSETKGIRLGADLVSMNYWGRFASAFATLLIFQYFDNAYFLLFYCSQAFNALQMIIFLILQFIYDDNKINRNSYYHILLAMYFILGGCKIFGTTGAFGIIEPVYKVTPLLTVGITVMWSVGNAIGGYGVANILEHFGYSLMPYMAVGTELTHMIIVTIIGIIYKSVAKKIKDSQTNYQEKLIMDNVHDQV